MSLKLNLTPRHISNAHPLSVTPIMISNILPLKTAVSLCEKQQIKRRKDVVEMLEGPPKRRDPSTCQGLEGLGLCDGAGA